MRVLPRHNTRVSHPVLSVWLCTGRLSDFAPEAQRAAREGRGGIIHFEIMPKQVDKIVSPELTVLGDCGANMKALLPKANFIPCHPEEEKQGGGGVQSSLALSSHSEHTYLPLPLLQANPTLLNLPRGCAVSVGIQGARPLAGSSQRLESEFPLHLPPSPPWGPHEASDSHRRALQPDDGAG